MYYCTGCLWFPWFASRLAICVCVCFCMSVMTGQYHLASTAHREITNKFDILLFYSCTHRRSCTHWLLLLNQMWWTMVQCVCVRVYISFVYALNSFFCLEKFFSCCNFRWISLLALSSHQTRWISILVRRLLKAPYCFLRWLVIRLFSAATIVNCVHTQDPKISRLFGSLSYSLRFTKLTGCIFIGVDLQPFSIAGSSVDDCMCSDVFAMRKQVNVVDLK